MADLVDCMQGGANQAFYSSSTQWSILSSARIFDRNRK